jgi:hypothetical protein
MRVAMTRPSIGITADANSQRATAKHIAYHALSMFIQDTKTLVKKAFSRSLKEGAANPSGRVQRHTTSRSNALTQWDKSDNPLSWKADQSGPTSGYALLLVIFSEDYNNRLSTLTHSKDTWSYEELAKHLYAMAAPQNTTISAPVVKNGCFVNSLRIAFKSMANYAPNEANQEQFCVTMMAIMMKKMGIDFVPWHRDAQGRGSPRIVQHDWWMIMTRHITQPLAVIDLTIEDAMQSAATAIQEGDPTAPWSIPSVLSDMGLLWTKTVLPDDWNLAHASLDTLRSKDDAGYVWQTYEYVQQQYDGRKWQHHMGLVWAILFSRITPRVSYDRTPRFYTLKDPRAITLEIRSFPWTAPKTTNRKGVTDGKPFVTMFSTAIIAVRDSESPLSRRLSANRHAFGDLWTDKHGEIYMSVTTFKLTLNMRCHTWL